jgi:signal transduction histidine kinase
VTDSGAGVGSEELDRRRRAGVGLSNIERRLEHYFGADASLRIVSAPGRGTRVEIRLPISKAPPIALDERPFESAHVDLPAAYAAKTPGAGRARAG